MDIKPGKQTTEFLMTVLQTVLSIMMMAIAFLTDLHQVLGEQGAVIIAAIGAAWAAISNGTYAIGRSILKSSAAK